MANLQLLCMCADIQTFSFFAFWVAKFFWSNSGALFEKKALRAYKTYCVTDDLSALQRKALNECMVTYVHEFQTIYENMKTYSGKSIYSRAKADVDNLRLSSPRPKSQALFLITE